MMQSTMDMGATFPHSSNLNQETGEMMGTLSCQFDMTSMLFLK